MADGKPEKLPYLKCDAIVAPTTSTQSCAMRTINAAACVFVVCVVRLVVYLYVLVFFSRLLARHSTHPIRTLARMQEIEIYGMFCVRLCHPVFRLVHSLVG